MGPETRLHHLLAGSLSQNEDQPELESEKCDSAHLWHVVLLVQPPTTFSSYMWFCSLFKVSVRQSVVRLQMNNAYPLVVNLPMLTSALTFRGFVLRLKLLTLFRDFQKGLKMSKLMHFRLFVYLADHVWFCFLYTYHVALILCCTTTDFGIFLM